MNTTQEKRSINKELNAVNKIYYPHIPLSLIFTIVENHTKSMIVQEDGTKWSGLLCGEDGTGNFAIARRRYILRLMWHRMSSGNYEIVSYVT